MEAYRRIAQHDLAHKNPTLVCSTTFGKRELQGRTFDFIWMSQLSYHLDDLQLVLLFEQARSMMHSSSVFLIDIIDPASARAAIRLAGFTYHFRPVGLYEELAQHFSPDGAAARQAGRLRLSGQDRPQPEHAAGIPHRRCAAFAARARRGRGRRRSHPGAAGQRAGALAAARSLAGAPSTRRMRPGCSLAGSCFRSGRPRDREHLAHVLRQHLAEGCGVARQRASLVPEDGQRLAQRFAPVGQADNSQRVPIGPQGGRNDGHAMSALRPSPESVCGVRLSNMMFGSNPARRQAASKLRRNTKL